MFDSIQMQEEERKILTGVENLKMSLYPANPRCPGSAADHISRFVWTSVLISIMQRSVLPIFPGAVVQSQRFSMVQLHLDAARTSLGG